MQTLKLNFSWVLVGFWFNDISYHPQVVKQFVSDESESSLGTLAASAPLQRWLISNDFAERLINDDVELWKTIFFLKKMQKIGKLYCFAIFFIKEISM